MRPRSALSLRVYWNNMVGFCTCFAWQHWCRSRAPASSGNCKNHTIFLPINVPQVGLLHARLLEEIRLDLALAVLGSTGVDRKHLPVVAAANTIVGSCTFCAWEHRRRSRAPASSGNCKCHRLDLALAVLGSTGVDHEYLPVVVTANTIPVGSCTCCT